MKALRFAIIGRTGMLLKTAKLLASSGHIPALVWTTKKEDYFGASSMDFKLFAEETGAYFSEEGMINSTENIQAIKNLKCDVALSVNWGSLISPAIIESFKYGILNAHAGALPKYKGNACVNWAILNEEKSVGICIHEMSTELDGGDIYVTDLYKLNDQTYVGDVYEWLNDTVPNLFNGVVEKIVKGSIVSTPQSTQPSAASYCFPRRPADSQIDWTQTNKEIHKLIRASSFPFQGAYSFLEKDQKTTIWRAHCINHPSKFYAVPGQVCYEIEGDPVVACGKDFIQLQQISISTGNDGKYIEGSAAKSHVMKSRRNRFVRAT